MLFACSGILCLGLADLASRMIKVIPRNADKRNHERPEGHSIYESNVETLLSNPSQGLI